jgi:hypothetical protein
LDEDKELIAVFGGEIEPVNKFPYLGLLIDEPGRMDADVDTKIAETFGVLRKAVFYSAY